MTPSQKLTLKQIRAVLGAAISETHTEWEAEVAAHTLMGEPWPEGYVESMALDLQDFGIICQQVAGLLDSFLVATQSRARLEDRAEMAGLLLEEMGIGSRVTERWTIEEPRQWMRLKEKEVEVIEKAIANLDRVDQIANASLSEEIAEVLALHLTEDAPSPTSDVSKLKSRRAERRLRLQSRPASRGGVIGAIDVGDPGEMQETVVAEYRELLNLARLAWGKLYHVANSLNTGTVVEVMTESAFRAASDPALPQILKEMKEEVQKLANDMQIRVVYKEPDGKTVFFEAEPKKVEDSWHMVFVGGKARDKNWEYKKQKLAPTTIIDLKEAAQHVGGLNTKKKRAAFYEMLDEDRERKFDLQGRPWRIAGRRGYVQNASHMEEASEELAHQLMWEMIF